MKEFTLILIFLSFTLTLTRVSSSASYGEPCYFTSDCDRSAELHCFSGHCGCARPSTMLFDPERGKCVSKAGEICYYWTIRHWTESFNHRQQTARLGRPAKKVKPDCVTNSYCSTEGRCVCAENYKAVNGLCYQISKHNDLCSENTECQIYPGSALVCLKGRCRCDLSRSLYKTVNNSEQCVGKAGFPCVNNLCTDSAICSAGNSCKCPPGSKIMTSGHCRSLYSHPCESSDNCVPELVCKDKRCSCKYADQLYDSKKRQCLSRVGEPCTPSSLNCIEGATCEPIKEDGPSHCVCAEGFMENVEGDCKVIHGGSCNASSECNGVASLVCLDGHCRCSHFAQFSEREGKCLGLVGAKCYGLREAECIRNASCKQNHPRLPGHCTCDAGHFEGPSYDCVPNDL